MLILYSTFVLILATLFCVFIYWARKKFSTVARLKEGFAKSALELTGSIAQKVPVNYEKLCDKNILDHKQEEKRPLMVHLPEKDEKPDVTLPTPASARKVLNMPPPPLPPVPPLQRALKRIPAAVASTSLTSPSQNIELSRTKIAQHTAKMMEEGKLPRLESKIKGQLLTENPLN